MDWLVSFLLTVLWYQVYFSLRDLLGENDRDDGNVLCFMTKHQLHMGKFR